MGMTYGLGKAFAHGRCDEMPWWIGFLVGVFVYGLAVEYTRRVMRRVSLLGRETPSMSGAVTSPFQGFGVCVGLVSGVPVSHSRPSLAGCT